MITVKDFSSWVKLGATLSVVSSVVMTLIPESKLKNAYKTLCLLLIIFAGFTALSSIDTDIYDGIFEYEKESSFYSKKTDEILHRESEAMFSRNLENELYEGGIECKCEAVLIKNEEAFSVSEIRVYGSFSKDEKSEAERIIYLSLKEECEVIFAEEKNAE